MEEHRPEREEQKRREKEGTGEEPKRGKSAEHLKAEWRMRIFQLFLESAVIPLSHTNCVRCFFRALLSRSPFISQCMCRVTSVAVVQRPRYLLTPKGLSSWPLWPTRIWEWQALAYNHTQGSYIMAVVTDAANKDLPFDPRDEVDVCRASFEVRPAPEMNGTMVRVSSALNAHLWLPLRWSNRCERVCQYRRDHTVHCHSQQQGSRQNALCESALLMS